jgi:hypothetical protein
MNRASLFRGPIPGIQIKGQETHTGPVEKPVSPVNHFAPTVQSPTSTRTGVLTSSVIRETISGSLHIRSRNVVLIST